jgi:hypothetical protein
MLNKKLHINITAVYIVNDVGTNTEIRLFKAYKKLILEEFKINVTGILL